METGIESHFGMQWRCWGLLSRQSSGIASLGHLPLPREKMGGIGVSVLFEVFLRHGIPIFSLLLTKTASIYKTEAVLIEHIIFLVLG